MKIANASLHARQLIDSHGVFRAGNLVCVATTLFEPPSVQISSSTIPRCQHSVYYPQKFIDAGSPNYGCSFCNSNANIARENTHGFSMPESGVSLTGNDGKLRANNYVTAGECPDCRSRIHYVSEKSSRVWLCADCGREFAAAKRMVQP
jgi:ribosomal protein L37AE/L43A